MIPQIPIRRRTDGSIDIEIYRQQGLMERRIVITGFVSSLRKIVRPAIAIAMMTTAICSMPGRDGAGWVAPNAHIVVWASPVATAEPATELYALNRGR
jgi:hypothetical protein